MGFYGLTPKSLFTDEKFNHWNYQIVPSALFLMLINIISGCQHDKDGTERIRTWPDNPHYLAWGDTPVFLLGPAGYHGWTPISRPAEMDFHEQLHRLDRMIREIGSPNVCGFVRCLPYDPMNHMHDGIVTEVLQPWLRLDDGRFVITHAFRRSPSKTLSRQRTRVSKIN